MTDDEIRVDLLKFPGVEEAPSYGAPGFRVGKKLLARIHPTEPALLLRVADIGEQEALIALDSKTFYITDHYRGHRFLLARRLKKNRARILEVFEAAWRNAASKKHLLNHDER